MKMLKFVRNRTLDDTLVLIALLQLVGMYVMVEYGAKGAPIANAAILLCMGLSFVMTILLWAGLRGKKIVPLHTPRPLEASITVRQPTLLGGEVTIQFSGPPRAVNRYKLQLDDADIYRLPEHDEDEPSPTDKPPTDS